MIQKQLAKRSIGLLTVPLCLLMLVPALAAAQEAAAGEEAPEAPAAAACESGQALEWIIGDWQNREEDTVFAERWSRAADGALEGFAESYSQKSGERYMTERMRIDMRDGVLQYLVTVEGQAPVSFRLTECGGNFVQWENPEHDFPKMLRYEKLEDGGFTASVTDGENQGFDLEFRPLQEQ